MPAIVVLKNGVELAAVNTDAFNIMTVNLHGDVSGEEFSTLDFFGGVYGCGDKDCHLLWVNDVDVACTDTIEIRFVDAVTLESKGKTIEEIYTKDDSGDQNTETMEQTFEYLEGLPRARVNFKYKTETSRGDVSIFETSESDWSYHCLAMWQNFKPDKIRVTLTSNELSRIRHQEAGKKLFEHTLHQGDWVKVSFIT
ncbi:hypothetical protein [Ketobacter alkanivorans]|uniref:Uncharacterized protein n=1 Tax=Ketobacter alkanivorans TaxID=1917421 RepID=A0A2K9LKC3_9GAMM|nr:hypothetical protein [Ketobacter alkanivorans]AUM11214.1 hypothetical protein Kalk_01660 [Ketobacter alkanivorans]